MNAAELHERITVCGLADLQNHTDIQFGYIISILDPDSPAPEVLKNFNSSQICALRFHDIVEETPGLVAPARNHIHKILETGRALSMASEKRLLIHCFAGLCRSTAAALLLIAQSDPSMPADLAFQRLLRVCPQAWPNPLMVRLGDEIMSLDGRLVHALERHQTKISEQYPLFGTLMRFGGRLPADD